MFNKDAFLLVRISEHQCIFEESFLSAAAWANRNLITVMQHSHKANIKYWTCMKKSSEFSFAITIISCDGNDIFVGMKGERNKASKLSSYVMMLMLFIICLMCFIIRTQTFWDDNYHYVLSKEFFTPGTI